MKIQVIAKPNSREVKVEKISENIFAVSVKEPPVKGLANIAIEKALAEYFEVAKSRVSIVSGFSSKNKVFDILN